MSRKFFAEHKSLNSKPISLLKIFILGQLIAIFFGFASSEIASIILILTDMILIVIINHHLANTFENIEILALQVQKLQTQRDYADEEIIIS